MEYLLKQKNLEKLKAFCSNGKVLFAFDFDGTLAKIVNDPSAVKMDRKTQSLMASLMGRASVAIISGRELSDLKHILPFEPNYAIGNHGLEGLSAFKNRMSRAKMICAEWEAIFKKGLTGIQGIKVENKQGSLSIHYRNARNKVRSRNKIIDISNSIRRKHRLILGKMVVDVLPSFASDKGRAIIELMKQTKNTKLFYIGDDRTDEDVFSLPNKFNLFKVRIRHSSKSKADFFLKNQHEINLVLKMIPKWIKTA